MTQETLSFSIVVPVKNEADNIAYLVGAIGTACANQSFEAVFVDDGSTDATAENLKTLIIQHSWLRVLQHSKSAGQSAAVHSGVLAAHAPLICTLDGDGQNPPSEIPNLLAALLAENCDPDLGLVAGQRVGRSDTLSKKVASRMANAIRKSLLRDGTRDSGCGLKAFRRDAFLALPYFNHMHRYLPALFHASGWKIAHCDVSHAERHAGRSNYSNFQRALVGIYDLIGVVWLIKRSKGVRATEVQVKN